MKESALDLLQQEELCVLILANGAKREGAWSKKDQGWHFSDCIDEGFVSALGVDEWWSIRPDED